jgi:enoyl-CoA hydratase/carnithine racemase
LDLFESEQDQFAETDGFYPLLATLLDYPFPTIALITGHAFGGAGPLALACDYRIMNSKRGFFNMPPIDVGKHFDGIGALPRLKLCPKVARKMLLESHKWTSAAALEDGIVDEICDPDRMLARAIEVAEKQAPRAKMGVYGLLRSELWGEPLERFKSISFVHRKRVGVAAKAMI